MELQVIKCPNCGSSLKVQNGIDTFQCPRCGYEIVLNGQSDTAINAKVNIKRMEHKERILERKYEQENYRYEQELKEKKRHFIFTRLIPGVVLAIVLILLIVSETRADAKKIPIPASSDSFVGDNYLNTEKILREAGFTNITMSELTEKAGALGLELFGDPGDVKEITVGGYSEFKQGNKFYADVPIVISYYSVQRLRDDAIKKLNALKNEIEKDIDNGYYSDALRKLDGLVYTATNDADLIAQWKTEHEKLSDLISLKMDLEQKDPSVTMPKSSAKYKGDNYNNVVDSLKAAGFTNIKLEPVPKHSGVLGILQKEGNVTEITINGSNSFKAGDKFKVRDEITIKYYRAED